MQSWLWGVGNFSAFFIQLLPDWLFEAVASIGICLTRVFGVISRGVLEFLAGRIDGDSGGDDGSGSGAVSEGLAAHGEERDHEDGEMEDAAAESVAEARCRERGELGQRCFHGSRQTYTRSCDL